MTDPPRPYGEGRIRSNVSYADVERAAIAILKSERRPTVETIREALGGGSPDTETLRAGKANIRYHLAYIGWLVRARDWLAGDSLSYADLAAAAHLSAVDYLGDVPWDADETAKNWYARIKSRPSFRTLLVEKLSGLMPSPTYANLDF